MKDNPCLSLGHLKPTLSQTKILKKPRSTRNLTKAFHGLGLPEPGAGLAVAGAVEHRAHRGHLAPKGTPPTEKLTNVKAAPATRPPEKRNPPPMEVRNLTKQKTNNTSNESGLRLVLLERDIQCDPVESGSLPHQSQNHQSKLL